MSGLNGFSWPDKRLIKTMNQYTKHRGSDDEGFFVDEYISMGHNRLKIIDLSEKAKQPMTAEDNSTIIIQDGTVYNFPDLKRDMEKNGRNFFSETDTEVILKLYQDIGTKSFVNLNGTFAFCIYDQNEKCLYLVRDKFGSKPLYYFYNDNKLIFSSELKSFNVFKDENFFLDDNQILEYFLTKNISAESFFKSIKAVTPGTYIKFDLTDYKLSKHTYFDIYKKVTKELFLKNKSKKEKELIEELDNLINIAVKNQLISNVPVGTICSGGVDSSLLTAIAKKYCNNLKVFTVRVEDDRLDESIYSRMVAEHLGLELIEEKLDRKTFKDLYKRCIFLADLPLIHPNSVGIHFINKKAKEHGVGVLLGGEGADELFGGYSQYKYFYRRLSLIKTPLLNYFNKAFRTFFYFEDFTGYILEDDYYIISQYKNLPWNNVRYTAINKFYASLDFLDDEFERSMLTYILKDLRYYMPPTLREADMMSMGAGIEMRTPFLDDRLVDFAVNLPLKYKVDFFKTKYLLKKVAERYLPRKVVYRKKMGFGLPTEKWLGNKDLDFKKVMYSEWRKHMELVNFLESG